jgi:hypothetical protein
MTGMLPSCLQMRNMHYGHWLRCWYLGSCLAPCKVDRTSKLLSHCLIKLWKGQVAQLSTVEQIQPAHSGALQRGFLQIHITLATTPLAVLWMPKQMGELKALAVVPN